MPLGRLREAERLTHEALDPCAQREMFAFQLLRIAFPHFMANRSKRAFVRPSAVGGKPLDPEGPEQGLQL